MAGAPALFYGADREHAVELGDRVEVRIAGQAFGGAVCAIHPRAAQVRVRYEDHRDPTRLGDPKRKFRRVPITDVDLIARD